LIAELCPAFSCTSLGIVPTVRHADYIGACLSAPRGRASVASAVEKGFPGQSNKSAA
jgi:antirestriction protein ArdC